MQHNGSHDEGVPELRRSRHQHSDPSSYLATPPPEDDPGPAQATFTLDQEIETARPTFRNAHTVHASASEFFQTPLLDYDAEEERINLPHMPVLTRQTTYSSLPPSPRFEDYGKLDRDRRHFDDALDRLSAGLHQRSKSSHEGVPPVTELGFSPTVQESDEQGLANGNAEEAAGRRERDDTHADEVGAEGLSLWDLLRDEVGVEDWDGWIVDGKWERIANFLAVPLAVEKVTNLLDVAGHR